jgi:polyhydroxyalkanoate synthesis regulator phasin
LCNTTRCVRGTTSAREGSDRWPAPTGGGDIVADSRDFIDDVIDRAKDVEDDLQDAARDLVDDVADSDAEVSERELEDLRNAVAELTAKVNELAAA